MSKYIPFELIRYGKKGSEHKKRAWNKMICVWLVPFVVVVVVTIVEYKNKNEKCKVNM